MDKLAKLQGDLKNASERMKLFFFLNMMNLITLTHGHIRCYDH